MLAIVKKVYRLVVPEAVRASSTVIRLKAMLGHDLIYSADYYAKTVEGPAKRSAGTMSSSIVSDLAPKTVVDVGCGTGALLEALRDRGCDVFGFEYSKAGLEYCRSRHLAVEAFDLESDVLQSERRYDVAVSMEVAEHLPERIADRYVDLLARVAPVIVFTAAPPGQWGIDHVNLQPPDYWIHKFQQRGLEHDRTLSDSWRQGWKEAGDVETWYYQNLMVFRRTERAAPSAGGPGDGRG